MSRSKARAGGGRDGNRPKSRHARPAGAAKTKASAAASTHRGSPSRTSGGARSGKPSVVKTLGSYFRFLRAGLLQRGQTGSILPSQKFLVEKMLAPIPCDYKGTVVELGPGSGVLTVRLARRCPGAKIIACEINPVLARDTQDRVDQAGLSSRVQVIVGAAEDVLTDLRARKVEIPFVVSGIPLGNLDKQQVYHLIGCIQRALSPGGMYIQFQHSLIDRKKIEQCFSHVRTVPALLNIPPAVVYYARK